MKKRTAFYLVMGVTVVGCVSQSEFDAFKKTVEAELFPVSTNDPVTYERKVSLLVSAESQLGFASNRLERMTIAEDQAARMSPLAKEIYSKRLEAAKKDVADKESILSNRRSSFTQEELTRYQNERAAEDEIARAGSSSGHRLFPQMARMSSPAVVTPAEREAALEMVEQFTGLRIGAPLPPGYAVSGEYCNTNVLKSFRYYDKATLRVIDGVLCSVQLKALFNKTYSEESVRREYAASVVDAFKNFGIEITEEEVLNPQPVSRGLLSTTRTPRRSFSKEKAGLTFRASYENDAFTRRINGSPVYEHRLSIEISDETLKSTQTESANNKSMSRGAMLPLFGSEGSEGVMQERKAKEAESETQRHPRVLSDSNGPRSLLSRRTQRQTQQELTDSAALKAIEKFNDWVKTNQYNKSAHKIDLARLCGIDFGREAGFLSSNRVTTGGTGIDLKVPFPPFKRMHGLFGAQPGHPMDWCHFGHFPTVPPEDLTIKGDYENEAMLLKKRMEELFGIEMSPLKDGKGYVYEDSYNKVLIRLDATATQGGKQIHYPLTVDIHDKELDRQSD